MRRQISAEEAYRRQDELLKHILAVNEGQLKKGIVPKQYMGPYMKELCKRDPEAKAVSDYLDKGRAEYFNLHFGHMRNFTAADFRHD